MIDKFSSALRQAPANASVQQRFGDLGTEPLAQNRATPETLRGYLNSEVDKWAPIIKQAGVYAD